MGYEIDLSGVTDRKQFHTVLANCLPLPAWYGKNLDALYDVLTDPMYSAMGGIVFIHCKDMKESIPRYFSALEQMCAAASEDNSGLSISFRD